MSRFVPLWEFDPKLKIRYMIATIAQSHNQSAAGTGPGHLGLPYISVLIIGGVIGKAA
jgi:hypothetical protein